MAENMKLRLSYAGTTYLWGSWKTLLKSKDGMELPRRSQTRGRGLQTQGRTVPGQGRTLTYLGKWKQQAMGTGLRGVGKVIRGQIKQGLLGKRLELFFSLKWEAIGRLSTWEAWYTILLSLESPGCCMGVSFRRQEWKSEVEDYSTLRVQTWMGW